MPSKIYYSPNMNNEYKAIRVSDINIKNDWNKISSLEFTTNKELNAGCHVVYQNDNINSFGGQILEISKSYGDFNKYTCLDYRKYLLRKVNFSPLGFNRSSDIIATLLKKYAVYSNSPIKLSISKTPKRSGFYKLVWENKTLLNIINELIYLEFINGTLIYCNIDHTGKFVYKPLPATMNIPVINRCIDGSYSIDYSDIKTSLVVDGKIVAQNKTLANIFGDMNELINASDNVTTYSPSFKESDNVVNVTNLCNSINKLARQFKYSNDGSTTSAQLIKNGKGTSHSMGDYLFNQLNTRKVKCKIVRYNTPKGSHSTVIVYNKKWINFPYNNMDNGFKPTATSLTKNVKVVKSA